MVLGILGAFYTSYFPTQYAVQITIGILVIYVLRALSQGRKTNRERDLHARIVLVTGGFTPLGLTILQSLAQRGAHVIALTKQPEESPEVSILIQLLRSTTSNEQIFAEECDLSSPTSVRYFCTKFLTGKEQRLDAIIFVHEHKHFGSPSFLSTTSLAHDQKTRDTGSLAAFLITTLLLPALLVAPPERDIRIINVVNPFYAAAVGLPFSPSFAYDPASLKSDSLFLREGHRSLRTIILTRHLQRVLDALPHASQIPKPEDGSSTVPVVSPKLQKSNIVSISVSPGLSRVDTISSLLNADWNVPSRFSYLGVSIYILLQPFFRILAKSPIAAMQTVLHVLFLPTPFKILAQATELSSKKEPQAPTRPIGTSELDLPEEVLRPGALYAECAMVQLKVNLPQEVIEVDNKTRQQKKEDQKEKGKGKEKEKAALTEDVLDIADDDEYGGELAGRLIWESYEQALKIWEKETPPTERDREREEIDEGQSHAPEPAPPNAENPESYY